MKSSLKSLAAKIFTAFADLVYPPHCLHCGGHLEQSREIFCTSCYTLLDLIEPFDRCPTCFSSDFNIAAKTCYDCFKARPKLARIASCFEYIGPAATLVKQMKYGSAPYIAKGIGGYLAMQFIRLGWPSPDLVVPVPMPFTHWLARGYNQSSLIAESFASILQIPCREVLTRKSGDFSQAGLSHKQRAQLSGATISLKKGGKVRDLSILLIDDVMTSGKTLEKCAEALYVDCPTAVYGLTFCRSSKS